MNFLLLSQLPRVDESRHHYDAMLHLEERAPRVGMFRRVFRTLAAMLRRA